MNATLTFTVNGQKQTITTDSERSLLDVLREDLKLTGAKFGCGEARCGCCSVLVDDKRVFSCSTSIDEVQGKSILTIEGISDGEKLHPVQEAFLAEGALQCGYCVPGMVMNTVAMLKANPAPTDVDIIKTMDRNLCRCCNYPRLIKAIKRAAGRPEK